MFVLAQSDSDFRGRLTVDFKTKLNKTLGLTVGAESRFKNDISDFSEVRGYVDVSNKFGKYFSLGGAYTYIAEYDLVLGEPRWDNFNKFNLSLVGSLPLKDGMKLSLRLYPSVEIGEGEDNWGLKSSIKFEYKQLGTLPVRPYCYFELRNTLEPLDIDQNLINRYRFVVGFPYEFNDNHILEFHYRIAYNAIPGNNRWDNIFGLVYTFNYR